MVSFFVFIESNVEINCGLNIYHHDVLSWIKCKTIITPPPPHIVFYTRCAELTPFTVDMQASLHGTGIPEVPKTSEEVS